MSAVSVAVRSVMPLPARVTVTDVSVPRLGSNWGRLTVLPEKLVGAAVIIPENVSVSAMATGAATSSAKATTASVVIDELRKVFMFRPLHGHIGKAGMAPFCLGSGWMGIPDGNRGS